jgi:high frequency lysogenization protein
MSQPDRLYPLCALAMAAHQVDRLANTGLIPHDELEFLIQSTLILEPESTLDVYGGSTAQLYPGGKLLRKMLGPGGNKKYPDTIRYFISLMQVERQLSKNPAIINVLRGFLEIAITKSETLGPTHEAVMETLNTAYQETISTLKFRIMVTGNHGRHLQQGNNPAKIRALLLSGIRSAMLYRQLGGGRLALLFQRGRVFNELDTLGL